MAETAKPPRIYDYVADPAPNNFGHLPFPDEGDTIWVGDDYGQVVERDKDLLPPQNREGDTRYTRYMQITLTIKI